MNKVIIIFGLFLVLIAGVAFYQFSKTQTASLQTKRTVTIKNQMFNVEVVTDPKAQQIGLTKYNALKENEGMLFLFDTPDKYKFWMKNMKFPIDMIFIAGDKIVSVAENAKPAGADEQQPIIYEPAEAVDKILEIKAGLIKKYEIKKGDTTKIETH